MATPNTKRAAAHAREPSEWALRELPARVVSFLHAVGNSAGIRAALESGGYGPDEHTEGLRLLAAVCAYGHAGLNPAEDDAARDAAHEIEVWVRTHLPRLRAALTRLHPGHELPLPEPPSEGPQALLVTRSLLQALTKLESTTPESPVLGTLARRGIDGRARQHLEELLTLAEHARPPQVGIGTLLAPESPLSREREIPSASPDLAALHRWFEDWSATAKVFVKRKDWLARMGVTRRR